jgi:hypothetical protein
MRQSLSPAIFSSLLLGTCCAPVAGADDPQKPAEFSREQVEFFEANIRPVLAEHCYECHSAKAVKLKGNLLLDTRTGTVKGGTNGQVVVPGDPEKSRLILALRWTDPDLAMPPKGKLSAKQVEKFEEWVKMGAPDPRTGPTKGAAPAKTIDLTVGRKWWAFQPVAEVPAPNVRDQSWPKKWIDTFVLQQLESKQLAPSPPADPRTLIHRAFLDLTGLRPTYEQVEAFAKDPSYEAYAKIIEQLLASPQYGQRWGRFWLDVARYGDDNPTGEATNPPYPYAWRYRDWVIQAMNRDLPYDRFVKLQLAGDLMPGVPRSDLVATGFLGAGPVYHKDGRLSKDVIENLYMDDWDERVDVVTRGLLGLTVACARCHDHKFDPIPTRDYYSLAGVFASTVAAPRPTADVDAEAETRFMAAAQRLFYLSYVANLMRTEPGSKPGDARKTVERMLVELDKIEKEIATLRQTLPDLHAYLAKLDKRPAPYEPFVGPVLPTPPAPRQRGGRGGNNEPYFHSVFDAGLWVDGSDPDVTMLDVRPGRPRDLRVLPGGNVANPKEIAPRGFLTVLTKGDPAFRHGSGRLELAERLFTDAGPLTARVIVNRVWGWHFGKPIVETPSDFGAQGDKPSHPQLLDDLAARFIANDWSLKWLHREIMLSATYRQASRPRPDAAKIDPANKLLGRMNPRRLDIEAFRDCLLQASGDLDLSDGGPSTDLDLPGNKRRTVYARVSRGRLNYLLQLYGFPEATMHSPGRETTTTPLQQLFVLNSPFVSDRAAALASSVAKEPDTPAKVRALYRKVLARDPTARELTLATDYLKKGSVKDYAHALLGTNEVIFWP